MGAPFNASDPKDRKQDGILIKYFLIIDYIILAID
jgi:hypothetical protein